MGLWQNMLYDLHAVYIGASELLVFAPIKYRAQ